MTDWKPGMKTLPDDLNRVWRVVEDWGSPDVRKGDLRVVQVGGIRMRARALVPVLGELQPDRSDLATTFLLGEG